MPALFKVMRLVASVMLALGVNVPVQVIPPSLLVTDVRVPLAIVRSALVKPVTASLNVMVTREVPPMFSAGLAITTLAVGRTVSMV